MAFKFKQFKIEQTNSAMKVGTDGVLLGAWCRVEGWMKCALDVGTGTGVIALMLAQRSEQWGGMRINAVELDEASSIQAESNVASSKWSDRVRVFNTPIQNFEERVKYDLMVSNPPYFVDALKSPNRQRNLARHTTTLDHKELLVSATRLLTEEGVLSIILPYDCSDKFISMARVVGLELYRRTDVISVGGQLPKRSLMEFCRGSEVVKDRLEIDVGRTELILEEPLGTYTLDYRILTGEFYLKF